MHTCGTELHHSHFENENGDSLGYAEEINGNNDIFNPEIDSENQIKSNLDPDPISINELNDSNIRRQLFIKLV